jgi:menaquinone-dependent protoporphyrinogen oxidase
MSKVLVAFASKYGSTEEIANKIAEVLSRSGLQVSVLPTQNVGDVARYEAVVLGSAVYAGHWLPDAVRFLEDHQHLLTTRPTWLFSSGPTGEGDPVEIMHGWCFPEAQKPIADRIKPRDIALFHGKIDPHKMHLGERLIVKALRAKEEDSRDWEAIGRWARQIAAELQPVVQGG